MSAFGQSVENSLADGYAKDLSRYVSRIVAKERAWLEERLKELKPGETWCHHEAVSTWTPEQRFETWSREISGHVLPPGVLCAALGARTQYGPAPDPWPPTECVPERGYHVTPHNGGGCFLR